MKSKDEVVKYFKECQGVSKNSLSVQFENTEKAIQFYNGDTMAYRDTIQFEVYGGERKRALVQFNKVQPNVDAVVGFMAQNRRHAKYIARLNGSAAQNLYSKYLNAIYEYTRENTNADQLESDQDADMMINGYGAIETDLSYIVGNATTDPNGKIIKCRLDPKRIGWDAAARAKNLLDASYVYYWDEYPLKQALDLFEKSKETDFEEATPDERGAYYYNPWGGLYDKIKMDDGVDWASTEQEIVRVFNFQWFEYETFYRADNPMFSVETPDLALFMQTRLMALAPELENETNGVEGAESTDPFVFDPAQEIWTLNQKQYNILKKEMGELLVAAPLKRKVYYTAVLSGTHVFSVFRSISQSGFSVKFKTGTYDAHRNMWVGMVNSMMEPAEYHNKALTELMFTIAANSKGGVMVEDDAVEDITEFESKWAKTDAVIKVNSGALAAGKIQEKTRAAMPTGLEGIITLTAASIMENGVDPSFVGNLKEEGQSGILYKRRIRQVISKMARYFDSITLYQKEDARLCADLIRVWVQNNNGEYVRITGEDGAEEFVLISEDNLCPEYDISIQEAAQTPEDKQETALMLKGMGTELLALGNPAGTTFIVEALSYVQIDGDVRNRLAQALQPQDMVPMEQFQALQQQLQQIQSEMAQVQMAKTQSEIAKNQASVQKTTADMGKTEAETLRTVAEAENKALENEIIKTQTFKEAIVMI